MIRFVTSLLVCFSLFAQGTGSIQTIAGTGSASFSGDGGQAKLASLNVAVDVAADHAGNLFIADQFNHRIRKIAPDGTISTVAGTGAAGYAGDGGPAINAQLNTPTGICADSAGNLYIGDVGNQRIRKVDTSGTITTLAGNGSKAYAGDGGPAINASFYNAVRVAVDGSGNVLVADQSNHRIRRVTPAGIISTFAGNGAGTPASGAFSGDGGPASSASLNNPTAIAVDGAGAVYISDQFNQRIRKVAADGTITTIAGNGAAGFAGDGGPAASASLNYPGGITVDAAGNIYFNDDVNFRTRRIAANGTISTVAGSGTQGFSGDGGAAVAAALNGNFGITLDPSGNLYIADSTNNRIREVYGVVPGLAPTITSGGIVPVYSSSTTIQSGSWVSIYGSNLAPATTVWNGNFPTSLGGVTVTIDSKPAYLWFVSPTQINLQAPTDSLTGAVVVVVTTPGGSVSSAVTLGQFAPSFSLLNGKYPAAIVLTPGSPGNSGGGYDIIGPNGAFSYPTRPVKAGETLILYGVGFGPTTPLVPAGQAFSGAAPSVTLPQITIGGAPATVSFGGIVQAGLYQFNIVVPNAASGDQPLQAMVGGMSTPNSVFVAVQ